MEILMQFVLTKNYCYCKEKNKATFKHVALLYFIKFFLLLLLRKQQRCRRFEFQ